MANTKKDKKNHVRPLSSYNPNVEEKYPYGLRLELRSDELKKLGLDINSFGVDEEVSIEAKGKILSIHSSESQGHKEQGVSIQITKLAVVTKSEDEFAEGFDS